MEDKYLNPDWTFRKRDSGDTDGFCIEVSLRLSFRREKIVDNTGEVIEPGCATEAVIMLGNRALVEQGLALELADYAIDRLDMIMGDDAIRIEVEEPPDESSQVA